MIYEYECSVCGHVTELEFSISVEKPQQIPCQKCLGRAYRILSVSNFILKGSGWAKDGYDKKAHKSSEPKPSLSPSPT